MCAGCGDGGRGETRAAARIVGGAAIWREGGVQAQGELSSAATGTRVVAGYVGVTAGLLSRIHRRAGREVL